MRLASGPIVFRCETKVEAVLDNLGKLTFVDFGNMDVILDYVDTGGLATAARFSYSTAGNISKGQWTFSSTTSDSPEPRIWYSGDSAYLTSRLNTTPQQGTFGYLTVSTPNGVLDSAYVDFTNAVGADCRYLHNNPTPPTTSTVSQAVLPLDEGLPTALTLYNYDTDRSILPALRLDKTSLGLSEPSPTKYQVWRSGALAGGLTISGTILVDVWGALQDYQTGVVGAVDVFLRDYIPTSTSHTEITNGTVFARDWQAGVSDFVERMALILGTNYTIPTGHEFEVWLDVNNESGNAMRISYDTNDHASLVNLSYSPPLVSSVLYLHNNPTPPTGNTDSQLDLPLSFTTPTATTLYNYDQERNGTTALQINKGTDGASETDPSKYQSWRTNVLDSDWAIKGDILIDIWMGLQDFALAKRGTTLYLRDYDPGSSSYTEIGNGSLFAIDWQKGSATFVTSTVLVPGVSYTILSGNMLEAKLTVENQSESAMWVAYDTTLQPSVINLPLGTAVPVFSTQATLTVLDGWHEKDANTLENLALTSFVQTSDNVRLETEDELFTSFQMSDVFIPANSTITSAVIYVEHHEEAAFTGAVEWRVGTGWTPPATTTVWGSTNATLAIDEPSETTHTWVVTAFVDTPARVNDMELRIENNDGTGKKTKADYIYVIVQWDEP